MLRPDVPALCQPTPPAPGRFALACPQGPPVRRSAPAMTLLAAAVRDGHPRTEPRR
ncbi:hypothetical protein [Rhizobacter sp. Root1221]|uniref:hypothetical protein n=1 Tax=Rhizobacter sp. Root1221 TaxID=1736433 RepID=UPI000A4D5150|nr:hypothetical protein [Rhizobacter sp. Root1221]